MILLYNFQLIMYTITKNQKNIQILDNVYNLIKVSYDFDKLVIEASNCQNIFF